MSSVAALLAEAGKATTLLLSRRELRRVVAGGEGLRGIIRELTDHTEECAGPASRDILESQAEDLGHAPAWIDAGGIYEELLAEEEADFVFCLDPWAAQLLSRAGEAAPGTRWIFVSDLDLRKDHPEYWRDMEGWFASLPWSMIVPRNLLEDGTAPGVLHRQQPGAWRWRTIAPRARERMVLLLVRFSGSFPHLKVFLDSVARQRYPKEQLSCLIVAKEHGADLGSYLRWHAMAHPRTGLERVDGAWEPRVNRALGENPEATVVLVDDHAVLPEGFARDVSALDAAAAFDSLLLSPEVTAHILTGNLDPLANYEKITGGFDGEPAPENARAFPAAAWKSGEDEPGARLQRLAGEPIALRRSLLQLSDLP